MDHIVTNGQASLKPTNSPIRRQGSMRKVLHASDGSDSMIGVPAKILERSEPKSLPALYYYNFFKEYHLMVEYNLLRNHLHSGVYVIPSAVSKFLWFGVIFVDSGIYKGGIFRFSIHISQGFPDSKCPRVLFESPVFHPNIDEETFELDVTKRFPEWCKETSHIWEVVDYLYSIFQLIDCSQPPINQRAAQMYINNKEIFMKCVNESIEICQNLIYNDPLNEDAHYFRFYKYNDKIHGNARLSLSTEVKGKDNAIGVRKGFSWIEPGTVRAFSKPFL